MRTQPVTVFSRFLQHVLLQRPAAAPLPGLAAPPRVSGLPPEPLAASGLPGGGSPAAEPARRSPSPDAVLQESRRRGGLESGSVWPRTASRTLQGPARVPEPLEPRVPGATLRRFWPQVRRQCHPGAVSTEL